MDPDEELSLIKKAKSDPAAFGILYEQNYPQIFSYIYRRVLDWPLAQDITADVFFKAYKSIWKFRWTGISISAWFYRIATNEINMHFRGRRHTVVSLDTLMDEQGFDPPDPLTVEREKQRIEDELRRYEDFVAIRARLIELPIKYQEVISLRYFEQKTNREIAVILGKNEGTVKSLISRGISKLKDIL